MSKMIARYVDAAFFSFTYTLLFVGMVLHVLQIFFPLSVVFVPVVFIGIFIVAIYTALIAQGEFNIPAILIGSTVGIVSMMWTEPAWPPYSAGFALLAAVLATEAATMLRKKSPLRLWTSRVVLPIHLVQPVVILASIFYSIPDSNAWSRPLVLFMAISGFLMWTKPVVGACPFTQLEVNVRKLEGRSFQKLKEEGFVPFYVQKLGISLSKTTYEWGLRIIAVAYFTWLALGFLAR